MKVRNALLAIVSAVVIGGVSSPAHSTTVPGMAGHGWPNPADTCLFGFFSLMSNSCWDAEGVTRPLIIPAQAPAGVYLVRAVAMGNGFNGTSSCQAVSADLFMNGITFSALGTTSVSFTPQRLNLGAIFVPGSGTLHFECRLAQGGGRVLNVEFATPAGG